MARISGSSPTSGGGGGATTSRYALQFSDSGARSPGGSLQSGGDLFGNLTSGSAVGQPVGPGTVREVAWRRDTDVEGSIRISVLDETQTEVAHTLVAAGSGVPAGYASGLSLTLDEGYAIAVLWDASSSLATNNLAVTVFVEPA